MSDDSVSLSSVTPRFARWIRALNIELEDVSSYHSQKEFWLEIDENQRIFVEVDSDGTLFVLESLIDVGDDSDLTQTRIDKCLFIIQQLVNKGFAPDQYQPCIKDQQLCLLFVGSVDDTMNAKAAIADFCATAAVIVQYLDAK